ncbi:hypothetical protein LA303_01240 [Candidatus Sulfidibacterium hydrothermale]|uniref:hypothetical protein n=1 Tax=Candidatus Sulfidibacterium hydrothermale TaxID=2875962 RepID=UPI001F0A06CA|nr:hypothetical protein [Candidatus Sulfidibacterium hydrothermale]UBM62616.1 hypothetical protein LA303_01240 [Candidatus Sulfidibacterium hydrothermale]
MNLTAAYQIKSTEAIQVNLEFFLEYLFDLWKVNTIYRGNIQTACTLLFQHIVHSNQEITLTASRQNDFFILSIAELTPAILASFKKHYLPDEAKDSPTKAIFLIQKVCDEVILKKTELILKFNLGELPEDISGEPPEQIQKQEEYTI